jgi:GTPase
MNKSTKSGYIAIIGRPNVGKSTLLNTILGQKISITSNKLQTTRHKILGIKTNNNIQAIYLDTPGMHKGRQRALNRYMNRTATSSLLDANVIIFMVEALKWLDDDELALENINKLNCPVILAVNKVDVIKNKNELLPFIEKLNTKFKFHEIIPISAKSGVSVDKLEKVVATLLPTGPFYFSEEQITDKNQRFLVAEIIREKLTRLLGQEVPHDLTVVIENFIEKAKLVRISAIIYVERDGQKAIVIGKAGSKLKEVNTKARLDIEKLLEKKIFLEVWVKVKSGWSDNERSMQELGYNAG